MSTLLADVRHTLRALRRAPAFAAVVILTLALGIGANTAIFSVLRGVLLRPLPYPEADRLMIVWGEYPEFGHTSTSLPDFLDWRAQSKRFGDLAGVTTTGYNLAGDGAPERATAGVITANFFRTLRVAPAVGRGFTAEEERPGSARVAVLGWEYWRRRFGGAADVLGRSITLNGRPHTVVGVAPRGISFPEPVDLWVPLKQDSTLGRRSEFLTVVGRLAPGATFEQASAEMATIAGRLAREYPETNATIRTDVVPLHEELVGDARPALLVFMGAVGLVLLVACGNVANLLLARAVGREREVALRASLGATRGRIVRQLVTESVVLAVVGGTAGVLLAVGAVRALGAFPPDVLPRLADVRVDAPVLAFALGVSALTGVLFGLAPALRLAGEDLQTSLRSGGRGMAGAGGVRRLRGLLVLGEVALSVVLLVGAGLLLRSFTALQRVDPGFNPEQVLSVKVALPAATYEGDQRTNAFWDAAVSRLAALPGVRSAAATSSIPMGGVPYLSFAIEGRPDAEPGVMQDAQPYNVTSGYFATMGVRLVRGRLLESSDRAGAARVAVINETMARKFWPGRDPIGARITFGDSTEFMSVVGVVADVRQEGIADAAYSQVYAPVAQGGNNSMFLTLRARGEPEALVASVRRTVAELDPQLPVYDVRTMEGRVADKIARPRVTAALTGSFALAALALAAVGIYGVVAYGVAQRTRELGVRIALGASGRDVLRLVVGQGMAPVAAGLAVGLVVAAAAARALGSLLYGVSAADPVTYAGVALFLGGVALLATWIPARRATRVPPLVALRAE